MRQRVWKGIQRLYLVIGSAWAILAPLFIYDGDAPAARDWARQVMCVGGGYFFLCALRWAVEGFFESPKSN